MENWEFLLQRKGDKSWLPLESPTVEILESQYRLAARSDVANVEVAIAIAYRPLADVRHQPFQQKIVKRISHDGLLIVMPYTNFVPGLWQIDCCGVDKANEAPAWKKTVKFDVIPISSEAGSEWQYSDLPEDDLEDGTEVLLATHQRQLASELASELGIIQGDSAPTSSAPSGYSSPILDIAEQRSTELVQSMFEEFALFNEEDEEQNAEIEENGESEREVETLSDRPDILASINSNDSVDNVKIDAPLQPRILLRLHQPQYIVSADNSFTLTGSAYAVGEIEVSLKDPQTLDVIVNCRYEITNLSDRTTATAATGAIPFAYQVIVPPPSEIQVLIGEVQIHPQQDLPEYGDLLYGDLFVAQQAIAVSYPASRVLPEMIKEAEKYSSQAAEKSIDAPTNHSSYPQPPQSFPQVNPPTKNLSSKPKPANSLSLPPLPSNKFKVPEEELEETQRPKISLSLPPLTNPSNKNVKESLSSKDFSTSESHTQSFPQGEEDEIDELQQIEAEFALADFSGHHESDRQDKSTYLEEPEEEPELLYSFEEELPQNYDELLEQSRIESSPLFGNASSTQNSSRNRSNRFLSKLQTLSADAIAAQKVSQRNEDLILDTHLSNESSSLHEEASGASIDHNISLDNPEQQPFTIAEANSFAKLDLELDVELDRLLAPEPDLILNEYVWEETVDPNTFPIPTVSFSSSASTLVETAQTIHNIQQESSSQSLSENEPIPIPQIIIAAGEIISGTPMILTVRLAAIAPKFFVKFWIKDLQTRMVVDGPRWLLDFSIVPNTEFIETHTNISIPLSSIDVAFEAIAIEAQTQRESHKARLTRSVTPPNLAQDTNFDYE